MKVLIIGFGSIGKRHYEILSALDNIDFIDIITKQEVDNIKTFKTIEDIANLNSYDYFVIASETYKHYKHLQYLENNISNKIIFCEKPLFDRRYNLEITNNKVFVGYVLRFHPLLQQLKTMIKNEKILHINAKCGQYLPTWRSENNYRNSYSAKRSKGGGVLLDLSHEIDYVRWLAGDIKKIKSFQNKISDLEIDSDDIAILIGKTNQGALVNISVDYISKSTHRRLLLDTLNNSYSLDFITNKLIKKSKNGLEELYSFSNLKRNYMFEQMHISILSDKHNVCNYADAQEVMQTIETIQEQNK